MDEPLFTLLENRRLVDGPEINQGTIDHLAVNDIIDVCEEAAVLTSAEMMPRERTMFVHSAASSLGAGRSPCSGISCRSRHARELAEFATVYSDRIYVSNFLAEHRFANRHKANPARLREEFRNDVALLAELRPLIEASRVVPVTFPRVHCPQCLVQDTLGDEADRKLRDSVEILDKRLRTEVEVTIEKEAGRYVYRFAGHADLLEHGALMLSSKTAPKGFERFRKLLARVDSGETVRLSSYVVSSLKLHHPIVRDLLADIAFDVMSTQALGTSFVTDRRLHIDMLQAMSADPEQERRNQLIETHLTTLIPFLSDVDTRDLLTIRRREEEAFVLFRDALNKSVKEALTRSGKFGEKEARELYGDVLAPGLARLDKKVKAAKISTISSIRRKGLANCWRTVFRKLWWALARGSCCGRKSVWPHQDRWRVDGESDGESGRRVA